MKTLRVVFTLLALLLLESCVEPYELPFKNTATVLIVEGNISNLDEPQSISLRQAVPDGDKGYVLPVAGARVTVLEDDKTPYAFTDNGNGIYTPPANFSAKAGHTYQLKFSHEGQSYESAAEQMPAEVTGGQITNHFEPNGIPRTTGSYVPAHFLYFSFTDPAASRNFYQWNWKLWERQQYCASCDNGVYSPLLKACDNTQPTGTTYDYECKTACWDIFRNLEITTLDDAHSNGLKVKDLLVARIPLYQNIGALVEIQQRSITSGAYRYLNLIKQQVQSTGGLADTPPAPLVGNIRNVNNPQQMVAGYFSAASVTVFRYWLDRQNVTVSSAIGFLGGRQPNPAPDLVPVTVECQEGYTRTATQPEGWR